MAKEEKSEPPKSSDKDEIIQPFIAEILASQKNMSSK